MHQWPKTALKNENCPENTAWSINHLAVQLAVLDNGLVPPFNCSARDVIAVEMRRRQVNNVTPH